MSTMVKVMCECSNDDEANLRVAEMKSDWEDTSKNWKVFHILMIIPTGSFWVGIILAKIFILSKVIVCLNCGEYLAKSNIRGIS